MLKSLPLKFNVFRSVLPLEESLARECMSAMFQNCPKDIQLIESSEKPGPGEPILGFCATGGTEAPFLKFAMENPKNPAVILVHDRANSYASGCELAARLNHEHKYGHRAPSVFCSVYVPASLRSVLRAAATSAYFAKKRYRRDR
jgi:hypothetical protein